MLKRLGQSGVSTHARALGFQKDLWSCGYQSLHLCDEVIAHRAILEDIDAIPTPLPNEFMCEALCIINADRSVGVLGTDLENGWKEEVTC